MIPPISADADPCALFGEGSESPDQAVPAVQAAPDQATMDVLRVLAESASASAGVTSVV
jgi:hypothetical protein